MLAIDQGTSSTKALVVSGDGSVLGAAEAPVHPQGTPDGGMEQDPAELLASVVHAGRRAIEQARTTIGAIGLANQGETVLAWEPATGEPLSTALSWQDRRSADICLSLAAHEERLVAVTGLRLDPYFAGPKMLWLRENMTRAGVVTTTDTWLLNRLTGAYVTDVTTASRTLLLNLDRRQWSPEACAIFREPADERPEVLACTATAGTTTAFGGGSVPVTGLAVDQQAALFGQGCRRPGATKCTYGTGAFVLANAGPRPRRSRHGLTSSVAWDDRGEVAYCLDGQVYTVGSMFQWLVDVGLVNDAEDIDRLGGSVPDSGGVTCTPALAGLGAPHWLPSARGAIEGLSLATTGAQLVRAALEGIAAQITQLTRAAAADLGTPLESLQVDGGLTRSRLLMQIQADLLQIPVEVFDTPHATALGIAELARRGSGDDTSTSRCGGLRYEPMIAADQAAAQLERAEAAIMRAAEAAGAAR